MQKFELLRYHIYILEDSKDCTEVLLTVPNRINVFAFDTETNTKINMAKRDENLINIKHVIRTAITNFHIRHFLARVYLIIAILPTAV